MPKEPYWSDRELDYMATHIGILSPEQIAAKLGRTPTAVRVKQHRLRIRFCDNFYCYTTLAAELGRTRTIVRKWYRRGWLSGRPAPWSTSYGTVPMVFLEPDIVDFLRVHYRLFDSKKVPNRYFANVVRECYDREQRREQMATASVALGTSPLSSANRLPGLSPAYTSGMLSPA